MLHYSEHSLKTISIDAQNRNGQSWVLDEIKKVVHVNERITLLRLLNQGTHLTKQLQMKHYSSFTEIDERLRILRLQREISKESLKLHLNSAKTIVSPARLVGGFSGIVQKLVLTFAIKKLSGFSRELRLLWAERKISRISD